MKIALVILNADPSRGGAERYTVDLATALAKRGHEVSLLASSFAGEIPGVRNALMEAPAATRAKRYLRFLDVLDRHLVATPYDIVHAMLPVRRCDVYHPHAGMAVEQMGQWNAVFNRRRVAMAKVERELLMGSRPPITIALSQYVKRSILKSYALRDDRLATLFNAVDLDRYVPGEAKLHDTVEGLIVAQDFERKGVNELFEAATAIQRSSAETRLHVTVVGGEDHLKGSTKSDNDRPYFTFAGKQPSAKPFYERADFFVLPTKHDPCSLVVLEALAMGLPVISTIYNGATEIMTDGVHGFILKSATDIDALAAAIRKMLNPSLRAQMRAACLALRPKLSYDHHLDDLSSIYDRAIQKPL